MTWRPEDFKVKSTKFRKCKIITTPDFGPAENNSNTNLKLQSFYNVYPTELRDNFSVFFSQGFTE